MVCFFFFLDICRLYGVFGSPEFVYEFFSVVYHNVAIAGKMKLTKSTLLAQLISWYGWLNMPTKL